MVIDFFHVYTYIKKSNLLVFSVFEVLFTFAETHFPKPQGKLDSVLLSSMSTSLACEDLQGINTRHILDLILCLPKSPFRRRSFSNSFVIFDSNVNVHAKNHVHTHAHVHARVHVSLYMLSFVCARHYENIRLQTPLEKK